MLDGVDELPRNRRAKFWEWVASFITHYPGNRVIITSRILPRSSEGATENANEQWNPPPSFVDAQLEDMSNNDIARFIEHWHQSVIVATFDHAERLALEKAKSNLITKLSDPINRRIRDLFNTPLLCAMVCVLHWKEEGYLPRQRVELYDRCCEMLIEARDRKREINVETGALAALTKNDKEAVLQKLAFQMMNNTLDEENEDGPDKSTYRIEIDRNKAARWLEPWIKNFSQAEAQSIKPDELLDNLVERTGLLREPASGLIDYPHRTFQEYLAACAAGADGQEQFLAKQAKDDQWHETIMLAAGTATGGVPFGKALIEALLRRAEKHKSNKPSSVQVRKTCIALALGCLENLRQQDAAVRSRVLSFLGELLPPQNSLDARILSVAGDAAVPLLSYSKWKDESTPIVSACAQALRLIGSTQSVNSLLNGYIGDQRNAVTSEVAKVGSIYLKDIPIVVDQVDKTGALPYQINPLSIEQLDGLDKLRRLHIQQPIPPDFQKIKKINIERLTLEGVDFEALSDVLPPGLKSISMRDCSGSDVSFVSSIPELEEIVIVNNRQKTDYYELSQLHKIESVNLVNVNIESLSFLRSGAVIKNLEVINCNPMGDISDIQRLDDIHKISFNRLMQVSDLSAISSVFNLKDAQFLSCPAIAIETMPGNAHLEKLSLGGVRVADASHLYRFPNLTALKLDHSLGEEPGINFGNFAALKNLSIRGTYSDCLNASLKNSSVQILELSYIHGFQKYHLGLLPSRSESIMLRGLQGFKDFRSSLKNPNIRRLAIHDCSVESLNGVDSFSSLMELDVNECDELKSIEHISALVNLRRLSLVLTNNLQDIVPVTHCQKLTEVALLTLNDKLDLSPLAELPSLNRLILMSRAEKNIVLPEKLLPIVSYVHGPGALYYDDDAVFYYDEYISRRVRRSYGLDRLKFNRYFK